MPTLRSEFTIEQFKEAFQKHAYQVALAALQNLPSTQPSSNYTYGSLVIAASQGKIDKVSTTNEFVEIESGISYGIKDPMSKYDSSLQFHIEEKIYTNSPHSTKISFYCDAKEVKINEKKIQATIDKIMEGVKPDRRFKLTDVPKSEVVLAPGEKYETLRKIGKIQ